MNQILRGSLWGLVRPAFPVPGCPLPIPVMCSHPNGPAAPSAHPLSSLTAPQNTAPAATAVFTSPSTHFFHLRQMTRVCDSADGGRVLKGECALASASSTELVGVGGAGRLVVV